MKSRIELSEALDSVDLNNVKHANNRYWWLNANPKIWSFSEINTGETKSYTLYSSNGHKRRVFQNFLDAEEGDIIICYESTPIKQITALAKVTGNDKQNLLFEKTENLIAPIDYQTLKECRELKNMEYFTSPQGSLFKLTQEEFNFIMDLIRDCNPESDVAFERYSKENYLNEVYSTEEQLNSLIELLKTKKNIILQGAPGVGKTYAARRLAYAVMNEKDDSRIQTIQFHQNYSYEDFIVGYKPNEEGFSLVNGIFYNFCLKASNDSERDYFFIIDEINRGNVEKIFGELLMLIEKEYRGMKMTLPYGGVAFSVPKNVYIIGMMNTADRSLAFIDYALRRRFSFVTIEPAFSNETFIKEMNKQNNPVLNKLLRVIKDLNEVISVDPSLGEGFQIGHSYFCDMDRDLKSIIEYDLIPTVSEYWFDNQDRVREWSNKLRGVLNE